MIGAAGPLLMAQADSARAMSTVYTVSLLATVPLIAAVIAAFALRRASAEGRMLVWRSAIVILLLAFLGRIPAHGLAWVVPSALSLPLVALGRVQVTVASLPSLGDTRDFAGLSTSFVIVRILLGVYLAGVVLVLLPVIAGSIRLRRRVARTTEPFDAGDALSAAQAAVGGRRNVRVVMSRSAVVPMTWGAIRPTIVVPVAARTWPSSELRIVLMHELAHVRASDWVFGLAARVACALYWFHPGAWWLARGLRADCELVCDDRVIASGVRRSDYAELLVNAAEALRPSVLPAVAGMALAQRSGLRVRLAALLDGRSRRRPLHGGWSACATAITLLVAGSMSAVRIAPSRQVLTTLMRDTRWQSRAYAVIGLAERQDSVAVAIDAAELDPNPRVRAWARYALGAPNVPLATRSLDDNK
jgi:beta-lactamase regulating signal transducer with metallopeptidase domain